MSVKCKKTWRCCRFGMRKRMILSIWKIVRQPLRFSPITQRPTPGSYTCNKSDAGEKCSPTSLLWDAGPRGGLSPHSLHLFEQLRDKAKVRLSVPTWKEDYFRLTGRQTAAECLEKIQALLPRSPYSSSASFLHENQGGGEIHDLMQRSLRIKNTLFLFRTGIAMGRETKTGYKNEKTG